MNRVALSREKRQEIINNLLTAIGRNLYYAGFSVEVFAKDNGLSRQSIYKYLSTLEREGQIKKLEGYNNYCLVDSYYQFEYPRIGLKEDRVWSEIVPLLKDMSDPVLRCCAYAFGEMINNAVDHSEGTQIVVRVCINAFSISFYIVDDGIGIFTKIASAMGFEEKRFGILELAKGKFTTDPDSHSGEGVFFSSKVTDIFGIFSDDLVFSSNNYQEGSSAAS